MKKLLAALALVVTATFSSFASATQTPVVKNVRFGSHPTFDRIVIDLQSSYHPQVRVSWPYSLRMLGSGKPVPLKGKANIMIDINPAMGHDGAGRNLYRGPVRIYDVRMKYIHGFQKLGDYEAHFAIGVTTDIRNPKVRVMRLTKPNRIVVDIYK